MWYERIKGRWNLYNIKLWNTKNLFMSLEWLSKLVNQSRGQWTSKDIFFLSRRYFTTKELIRVTLTSGEILEYQLAYYGDNVSCRLYERNSCERALCECDLEFARGLPEQIDSNSDDFHTYWSLEKYKWNPKEDCVERKLKNNDLYHEISTFIRNPDF